MPFLWNLAWSNMMSIESDIVDLLSDMSDIRLLTAFDDALGIADYAVMWRLVDEIERRRLDL